DEGVKPDEFHLIERGVVVDYLAQREHVPGLADWYQKRGEPVRAHGVATSRWWIRPEEWTPNLTIEPGQAHITVDDMIKDVKHGIYLSNGGYASGDFGLTNAYGTANKTEEIRNGKIVGERKDAAIQFSVQSFWKGLLAIGGPASAETFAGGN